MIAHEHNWLLVKKKYFIFIEVKYIVNRSELAGCLLQVSLLTWSDRKRMKDAVYKNFIIIIIIMTGEDRPREFRGHLL